MYVEQKTLGDLGRFSLKRTFKRIGNVVTKPAQITKRIVQSGTAKRIVREVRKAATYPLTKPTDAITRALSKVMPMPKYDALIPADTPSGPLLVSSDPYVNQMSPAYQTYPVAAQSDYYPAPLLPPQDGTYLNADMTQFSQSGNDPAPAKAADAGDGRKKALLYGGIAAAAAFWYLNRK